MFKFLLLFLMTVSCLVADQVPDYEMEPVVVRALGAGRQWNQAVQPVTVVTRDELLRLEGRPMGDVLEGQPGALALVKGNGFPYGKSGINLRSWGMGSEIVVAIDGRRISNDTDGEGFDLSLMHPGIFGQMELARGALSSLYGSGAHAGVVHFSTMDGISDPGSVVGVSGGSFGYHRESVSFHQALRDWNLSFSAANQGQEDVYTPDHGKFENSASHNSSGGMVLSRPYGDDGLLKLTGLFGRGFDNGLPGDLQVHALNDRDLLDDRGYGRLEYSWGQAQWRWKALVDANYKSRVTRREGPVGTSTRVGQSQLSRGLGVQIGAEWKTEYTVGWTGVEAQFERHEGKGSVDDDQAGIHFPSPKLPPAQVANISVFAQEDYIFDDKQWVISIGGRLDWHERKLYEDSAVIFSPAVKNEQSATGHAGIVRKFGRGGVRVAWGTSYVAPNIIQLYTFNPRTGFALLGNPSLAPEKGYSADASLFFSGEKLTAEVGAYTSDMKGRLELAILLRDFAGGGTSFKDLNGAFTRPDLLGHPSLVNAPVNKWFYHRNLGLVRIQGFEGLLKWGIGHGWFGQLSGSLITMMKEVESDTWLTDLAPFTGRASIGYSAGGGELSFSGRLGGRFDSISRTRPGQPRVSVAGYTILAVQGKWNINEEWQLFGLVDNFLNQSWQTSLDVPGPGISGRAGVRLRL